MISPTIYLRYLLLMQRMDPDKKYLAAFERKYQAAKTSVAKQAVVDAYYAEAHRIGITNTLEYAIQELADAIRKSLPEEDTL